MPPAPGMIPTATSGWPKWAEAEATRIVHASASSQPPPHAWPPTAAITGCGMVESRSKARLQLPGSPSTGSPRPRAERSSRSAWATK